MNSRRGPQLNISQREYALYHMARRFDNQQNFHWLWWARKLAQLYVISTLNRIEREELEYQKTMLELYNPRICQASTLKVMLEKTLRESVNPNGRIGKVFRLPQTFAGGRSYYQKAYANLMTMVRRLGNPDLYVNNKFDILF